MATRASTRPTPAWLPKWNFLCQMKHARAALLFSVFDPGSKILRIRAPDGSGIEANPMTPAGRERIGAFLADYMGEEARGQPTFHHIPGHVFGDQKTKVVSLNNLASLRDYEVEGRRPPAPPPFPRQHLVQRRPRLGRTRLDRTGVAGRRGGVAGAEGHDTLSRDRSESGDRGARCRSGRGTSFALRPCRAGRACRSYRRRPIFDRRCNGIDGALNASFLMLRTRTAHGIANS